MVAGRWTGDQVTQRPSARLVMLVDDEEVNVNAVAIAIAAMKESMDFVVCSAAQKLVATTLRPLTPLLRLPTRCLQPPAAPPIAPSGTTSWRMQSHHASCRLPRVVMSQNIISPSHSCLGSFGQTFVYRQRLALWRRSWRSVARATDPPGTQTSQGSICKHRRICLELLRSCARLSSPWRLTSVSNTDLY